jgi:hypothetical protein
VRHVGAQVIEQRLPGAEHRPVPDLLLEHPERRRLHHLERRDRAFAEAANARDRLGVG